MWKQFTSQNNAVYLESLPKLLYEYNHTKHSSTKMTLSQASENKNEGVVYFYLYNNHSPSCK